MRNRERRVEILLSCIGEEQDGSIVTISKAMKIYANEYHKSKKKKEEVNPMASPIHFGRWLLKNATDHIDSTGSIVWLYKESLKNTDELYLIFINELEHGL